MKKPWWQIGLAWYGIVAGFTVFLTIPGWYAWAGYKRWRQGEVAYPTVAWVTGGVFAVLAIVLAVQA